jgi:hypothetical protein
VIQLAIRFVFAVERQHSVALKKDRSRQLQDIAALGLRNRVAKLRACQFR